MQCDDAGRLMAERLDGGDAEALNAHLATCGRCRSEWADLRTLDTLLQGEGLVAPPPDFQARVMARVDADHELRSVRRQLLLGVATLVTGLLGLASGLTVVARGGHRVLVEMSVLSRAAALIDRLPAALRLGMLDVGGDVLMWPLHAALALAMACVWFGALVLPRVAPRYAGQRP